MAGPAAAAGAASDQRMATRRRALSRQQHSRKAYGFSGACWFLLSKRNGLTANAERCTQSEKQITLTRNEESSVWSEDQWKGCCWSEDEWKGCCLSGELNKFVWVNAYSMSSIIEIFRPVGVGMGTLGGLPSTHPHPPTHAHTAC